MKRAALIAGLLLAACGKDPAGPKAPTPEALGAELASFRQLLVPISTSAWTGMQDAVARNDPARAVPDAYPQPYAHDSVLVEGKETPAVVAFTGVWLAPSPLPLRPMSVQQFLRAFGADAGADLASVIAPKGRIFFTREQLPDVIAAARAAGASDAELPYGVVRGAARRPGP